MAGFKHLGYTERLQIESMYNKLKCPVKVIADTLGFHYSTIYREVKRGLYVRLDSLMLQERTAYSADIAQQDYNRKASAKGAPLKIGKDFELVRHIETKIIKENYSPGAVVGEIKEQGLKFNTVISKTTLYRYIDCDLFLGVSNKDLPYGKRRRKYNKVRRVSWKTPPEKTIEKRPAYIEGRQEFGHWEMDTVYGQQGGKSACLLVLTERKTRQEIVMKILRRTSACVVNALDKLERKHKGTFGQIFKSITVDNGSEFMDYEGIEKNKRTILYYCHPYSSFERGSNENTNKMIRRFIPKGTRISKYTHEEIRQIEYWINTYPRGIHGYKSSGQLFNEELKKLPT